MRPRPRPIDASRRSRKSSLTRPLGRRARRRSPPGSGRGPADGPQFPGWFSPYYGTLHWSDGTVVWKGYNPGNIDLSYFVQREWIRDLRDRRLLGNADDGLVVHVRRSGEPQLRPHDLGPLPMVSIHLCGRWLLGFEGCAARATTSRQWATSTTTRARAAPTCSTWATTTSTLMTVSTAGGQCTTPTCSAPTGPISRVSSAHSTFYARGGGSYAELNFSDGNANYMGVPWVYID